MTCLGTSWREGCKKGVILIYAFTSLRYLGIVEAGKRLFKS